MPNQYVNKVVYGGNTLIDLTADTITVDKLAKGITAHDKSGAPITGTNTFDSDTSDDTAIASEILDGKTVHARGTAITGTMPNRGSVTGVITTKAQQYTIQQGCHDGSGTVSISSTEQAKIIATNIRQGVTILGVEGTMSGTEDMDIEPAKTVTPTTSAQTVLPAEGYDGMAQVTVAAIPYVESDNSAGGKTVTIAGAA